MKRDPLQALGAHVVQQQARLLETDASDEALRHRLVQRVLERGATTKARGHATRHWFALAAGVSVLVLALGFGWLRWFGPRATELRFSVGDRPGLLGRLEAAPTGAALALRFFDGSVLDLTPSARARVIAMGTDGAEVVLESGRARVDIVPRPGAAPAHWQLHAGPFTVQVKGTSFWLSWDPAAETFSLELLAGKVAVAGCGLGAGRDVFAGERLELSCGIPASAAPPPPLQAAQPVQLEPAPVARKRSKNQQPAPPSAPTRPSWQELAGQGDFSAAYARAAPGWDARIAAADGDDLLLLGQSARLTGHSDEAKRAYAAVLERFAGSAAAARAAFSLGLLAFEQDPEQAIGWLERCLSEQPSGPLARPALDRSFEASLRLPQPARRRAIAARYLEQYPEGPHAAEARRSVGGRSTETR